MDKIDTQSPYLKGKIFKLNGSGDQLEFPPRTEQISPWKESDDESLMACELVGCDKKVKISDKGNREYAWYYLTNGSDKNVGVTIERRWIYEGRLRTETVRYQLYPREDREVFSFPRNQNPMCCILSCNFG